MMSRGAYLLELALKGCNKNDQKNSEERGTKHLLQPQTKAAAAAHTSTDNSAEKG